MLCMYVMLCMLCMSKKIRRPDSELDTDNILPVEKNKQKNGNLKKSMSGKNSRESSDSDSLQILKCTLQIFKEI